MIGWRELLVHFGRFVANTPEPARVDRSEKLIRRADRVLDDLRAVRRIEIVVRRR